MVINQVEKDLIQYIKQRSKTPEGIPGLGIGDDAAFLLLSSMDEGKLIVSTDSVIETVHYKREWCSYSDVAVKLVERASSDILAKGGHPHWALLNMNITEEFSRNKKLWGEFADAVCDHLKLHNIALIGGDIAKSPVNSFTMTVFGNASTFIRRVNPDIEAGDLLVVSGKVGASSSALDAWAGGKNPDEILLAGYRRPQACWDNQWLMELDAKASMDQSDSVMETLECLSSENKIHLEIDLSKIPLSAGLENYAPEDMARVILKAAEDLAIFAIIPSGKLIEPGKFNQLAVIGKVASLQKSGLDFLLQNKPITINSDSMAFYQHF